MDSCNSGSLQSSSGCDDEFDSRTEPIAAFFNSSSTSNILSPLPNFQQPSLSPPFAPSPPPLPPPPLLDSLPSYLYPPDVGNWPRQLQQAPPQMAATEGIPTNPSTFFNRQEQCNTSATSPSVQPPGVSAASRARTSKKRTRASRRAPTTVLTTDTANFRAMVQEFTGIPTPPFMPFSPLPPPRPDLLHPYLLRPFAQKGHASSSLGPITSSSASPSIVDAIASMAATCGSNPSNACSNASTSLASSSANLGLGNQYQNLFNMQQNPLFAFQSMHSPHTVMQQRPPSTDAPSASRVAPSGVSDNLTMWAEGSQKGEEGEAAERGGNGLDSWILSSD